VNVKFAVELRWHDQQRLTTAVAGFFCGSMISEPQADDRTHAHIACFASLQSCGMVGWKNLTTNLNKLMCRGAVGMDFPYFRNKKSKIQVLTRPQTP